MTGVSARNRGRRRVADAAVALLIALGTLVVLVPLFLVLWYLISSGISSIDWAFFTELPAPVGREGGGVAHAIVGSLQLVGIASVIGIILGVGSGILVAEYPRNPIVAPVRLMSDVLVGVPAIVTGLVVYGAVVVAMGRFSALAGGIALGLIMIPYVVRATDEVLQLVPQSVREAGLALGLARWRVTLFIVLPAAVNGIATGVLLAVARVAGEAAPLLFTAFGNQFWSRGIDQPTAALPLVIYSYSIAPYPEWHRLASASSLVLVALILVTTLLTRLVFRKR